MQRSNQSSSNLTSKRLNYQLSSEMLPIHYTEQQIRKKLFNNQNKNILIQDGIVQKRSHHRNRSLSSSKSRIFASAHKVTQTESFCRKLSLNKKKESSIQSRVNLEVEKKRMNIEKVGEELERKHIIKKVLNQMKNHQQTKLTLRGEMQKNRQSKIANSKAIIDSSTSAKLPNTINTKVFESVAKLQNDLQQSKQFNYSLLSNGNEGMSNSYLSNENTITKQLATFGKQLTESIKGSLKQQFQQIYKAKEQELQTKYAQRQNNNEKIDNISKILDERLKEERKFIIENIGKQLDIKLDKIKLDSKRFDKPEQVTQMKDKLEDNKKLSANINNNAKIQAMAFQQINTIEIMKQESLKKQPNFMKNNIKQPKNTRQQIRNIKGSVVGSDANDDIQEINLNLNSKQYQNDKSFNKEKKINQSFSSERPKNFSSGLKKQQFKKQINLPKSSSQIQQQKKASELEKAEVRKSLLQLNKIDPYLTAIGQIVSYCSKLCKKSKIQWRVPALLLYRYCYDSFRSYNKIYEKAEKLKLISQKDVDKFIQDNSLLKENLLRLYKATQKKVALSQQYSEVIESDNLELGKLVVLTKNEVFKYISNLGQSIQSDSEKGDGNVVQCGLRMINSIFIIDMLNGGKHQILKVNIQQLKQDAFQLFQQWSGKLQAFYNQTK